MRQHLSLRRRTTRAQSDLLKLFKEPLWRLIPTKVRNYEGRLAVNPKLLPAPTDRKPTNAGDAAEAGAIKPL